MGGNILTAQSIVMSQDAIMRIKLATPLIGEFPRYANVKLPDNAAVTAQNMRLDSGV